MTAPTTIHDLPDDMLHEIFGRVFSGDVKTRVFTHRPTEGAHRALRRVCRRWCDIADWVRLSTSTVCVDTSELADVGAVFFALSSLPSLLWAPLADQVTSLTVHVESGGYKRPSTGIVAGLGVLTAMRVLSITANFSGLPDPGLLKPVSLDRVVALEFSAF